MLAHRRVHGDSPSVAYTLRMGTSSPVQFEAKEPPPTAGTYPPEESTVEERFRGLVDGWKTEMRSSPSSDFLRMVASPNYQRIIGMGPAVVPLLLAELEARPDHWGWALEMITGQNPVPPEAQGKMKAIASAWLAWGRANRLI